MKCQNCGKQEVNVHYSSNINGRVTEYYLCSECAEQMGYGYQSFFGSDSPMGGFMPNGYPFMGSMFPSMPSAFGFLTPVMFTATPQMGILIQNTAQTSGAADIPLQNAEVDADMKKRRELNMLREQMRKAADSDDFERAIELRNMIKELEV